MGERGIHMPSIMVYTEETFYYTENIRVVAQEEYMRPDVTNLNFYQKDGLWFSMKAPYSIYTMQGIRALIEMKLKERGNCSKTLEFLYSRKKIEYSYSEKQVLDSVIFYITKSNQPGILSVMEQINHSSHLCSWNLQLPYHDFIQIRQYTDTVFYGMFQQQA